MLRPWQHLVRKWPASGPQGQLRKSYLFWKKVRGRSIPYGCMSCMFFFFLKQSFTFSFWVFSLALPLLSLFPSPLSFHPICVSRPSLPLLWFLSLPLGRGGERWFGGVCGTRAISLRLFLGRARSLIQQGLIQQIDQQPGPVRYSGRAGTWPGDCAAYGHLAVECQLGSSQVYLTCFVSNQQPHRPLSFWLTQAPEERGRHRGAGNLTAASQAALEVCVGWPAGEPPPPPGGFRRLGVKDLAVRAGRAAGPRPPLPQTCLASCAAPAGSVTRVEVAWSPEPDRGLFECTLASPGASHALRGGACFYVLRFISPLPNNSPSLVIKGKVR